MSQRYESFSRGQLLDELKKISSQKKYGLVWEEYEEEVVEKCKKQLPVLKEVKSKEIKNDNSDLINLLIEGDNYHALSVLSYTHQSKIDLVYIDPPYNTGKSDEWKYNDKYIDGNDTYRHSKWLSFMSKRLSLLKGILKETGVILISIDDNEQANLKVLCDEIFGEKNFVATIIWRGGKRNASKYISTSHEYILFYAKNLSAIGENNIDWKVRKTGIDDIYRFYEKLKKQYHNDYEIISAKLKSWYKELPADNPAKDHQHYCWADDRGIYFASDISRGGGGGPKWKVVNPLTQELVKIPARGWAFSKKEDMELAIKANRIHFNGSAVPCFKRYLKENESTILDTIFYKDRRAASLKFRAIMGDGVFDFPKDHEIISYFIEALTPNDATILDFFAGSGTTGQSVLDLNRLSNDSNRKYILATNNEGKICSEVCFPRLEKIINGYKDSRSGNKIEGLGGNLKYFETDFVAASKVSDDTKYAMVQKSTEMICVKENTFRLIYEKELVKIYENDEHVTAILYDLEGYDEFKEELAKIDKPIHIYLFSLSSETYDEDFDFLTQPYDICPIPDSILKVYKRIFKG